jgi:catechol 2,3-dioxygenase-like lactoylglutathione lyase family enzyme
MRRRGLDHLVLTVRDLPAAEARYRALGFTLTPPAQHPFGTGNQLAIFHGNFLELLAVTQPERLPQPTPGAFSFGQHTAAFIERHEGLSFVVLDSADARADRAQLAAAGLDPYPVFDFSRRARQPDGSEPTVAFSLVFVVSRRLPGAPHFLCQQHNPEHFWRPDYQRHANGARQIVGVTLAVAEPNALRSYYAGLFGAEAIAAAGRGLKITTGRGQIEVLASAELGQRYPGLTLAPPPAGPSIVGFQVQVEALAQAADCVARAGIAVHRGDGRVSIAPADNFSAVLEFIT